MTPSRRLLVLSLGLVALGLLMALEPTAAALCKAVAALVAGVAVLDFWMGRRERAVTVSREVRHSIPVGVRSEVVIGLRNPSRRPLRLRLHDHYPQGFSAESMPRDLVLPAERGARIAYPVRPERRGDAEFAGIDLVVDSPLGLWRRKRFYPLTERVRVFPNFREIGKYALLAVDNRLSQIGVRRRQRRGEGQDFHQLREYRFGDSLRQIDWKASSRYRRLISKEYQDERDQQVIFLLDCGRRMRHAQAGEGHLDQALNAMLLLAYVAAGQGDAVGFMAFGGPRRWLPPRKGGGMVHDLLYSTYDLESSPEAADYLLAARELMALQRRRALIVLLTNTRDEDHEDLRQAARLLAQRHLVVVADLRESFLDRVLSEPVRRLEGALRFQAVSELLASRRSSHELLHHHGVLTLDLLATQLPVALVNKYLTIKASGEL